MLHEPAVANVIDNAIAYKMKIGVIMFIVYAIIYAGFVAINIFNPILMEAVVFSGLNVAVVYGFGLIVFALILALVYNSMCEKKEKELNSSIEGEEK